MASYATKDDAVVYQLNDDTALVLGIDYITPVVDDPYAFGAIAAANAFSDVYAMGARPVLALNLVGFATKTLPLSLLEEIMRGGSDKVREAGAWIVGGHSIEDYEPKYGLVVVAFVHPQKIVRSNSAQPGDRLVLTKALGHGLLSTGIDQGLVSEQAAQRVTAAMSQLNRTASETMLRVGVHACTDIGGFGLLGQLHVMADSSGVAAKIRAGSIPVLPEAGDVARQDAVPNGTRNNQRYFDSFVTWDKQIGPAERVILHDAQPSGGLLIAVAPEREQDLLQALKAAGVEVATIGEMAAGDAGHIMAANEH